MARQLDLLDTHEKLANLILTTDETAPRFLTAPRPVTFRTGSTTAVLATYQSAFSLVQASREQAVTLTQARVQAKSWLDHRRDAETQSSLGDLLDGRHRQPALTRAAAEFFDSIEQVATCLHAEFAAVPPAVRLTWIERYSQFDRPAPLRDLTVLPGYGRLPRDQRRRFQDFINWLFDRVVPNNASAFSLINDLVRMCLLLASHAPVNQIITGHLPRPVPVRPGALIPIRPASPPMVRVGMEFHIWRGPALVAQGRVEDLNGEEVTARVLTAQAATLDSSMRVQFVPAALGIIK